MRRFKLTIRRTSSLDQKFDTANSIATNLINSPGTFQYFFVIKPKRVTLTWKMMQADFSQLWSMDAVDILKILAGKYDFDLNKTDDLMIMNKKAGN